MLTLITGTPGAGKTLFTLEKIKRENIPQKGSAAREVFVNGIPDLDYRYFGAKELVDPELWYECPEGSIIVIDEAQRVFPQRTKDSKPKSVEMFATHRHKGHDVFITTQDATNVDVFLRRMTGRHYHIKRILNRQMATVYEYDHYESLPMGYHEKKQVISTAQWRYPKKLFDRYKSATQHTHKARMPFKLILLPIGLVFSLGTLWYVFHNFNPAGEGVIPSDPQVASSMSQGMKFNNNEVVVEMTIDGYMKQFQPVVPGLQHSAPYYQALFEAVSFPQPNCVVYNQRPDRPGGLCKCLTQQGTDYDTSENNCRYWVYHGWFNPTQKDRSSDASAGPGAQPGRAMTLQ